MIKGKKIWAVLLTVYVSTMFSACTVRSPEVSKDIFAMDTFMNIRAYGENADEAVELCVQEIEGLEDLFDAQDPKSEISALNREKTMEVSIDTADIISRAREVSTITDGAFDITVYPIVKEWGFTSGEYKIPDRDAIEALLENTGQDRIVVGNAGKIPDEKEAVSDEIPHNTDVYNDAGSAKILVQMPENFEIGLGGIAKGYASDRLMEIFGQEGIGAGIVSLGGNVAACGTKPDGKPWRVAIENPDTEKKIKALKNAEYIGVVEVSDKSVITSGGYERFFDKDGVRYHHIIDPKTGNPADSGLISVSIISDDGCLADGLSTALFVMGKEKALQCWCEHKSMFDCILVESDGSVTITEGLKNSFSSDLPYEIYR